MGSQLAAIYAEAESLGGFRAKLTVAQAAGVPTSLVSVVADEEQVLALARRTLAGLKRRTPDAGTTPVSRELLDSPTEYANVSLELLSTKNEWVRDLDTAARRITAAAGKSMRVERAGVWILAADAATLRCVVTYIRSRNAFEGAGMELSARDYPAYFRAIRTEAILDAEHAHTDPRTSGFSANYLRPLNIQSMLDVPLWSDGEFHGVLCCEHVGTSPREWSPQVQRFGLTLTQILSQHWSR
jgi:hypothetical protein